MNARTATGRDLPRQGDRLFVVDGPDMVGAIGALAILAGVRDGSLKTLGVATGSSPLPIYTHLQPHRDELGGLSAFALDEYVGLPYEHAQSYHAVIHRQLTVPLGLDAARVRVPDGNADDLERAGRDYEAAIAAAGGIDLQIVGIGSNGHIGFNEPGSAFDSRTRSVELSERTRRDNARFFASHDDVPTRCLTQGIGTIMDARTVLLVATGESKADAVAAALEGPEGVSCPASVLQRHPDLIVVLDHAAAAGLRHRDGLGASMRGEARAER